MTQGQLNAWKKELEIHLDDLATKTKTSSRIESPTWVAENSLTSCLHFFSLALPTNQGVACKRGAAQVKSLLMFTSDTGARSPPG